MPDQRPAVENTRLVPRGTDAPVTAMTGSDEDHYPGGGGLCACSAAAAATAPRGIALDAAVDVTKLLGTAEDVDRQVQSNVARIAGCDCSPHHP